MQRMPPNRRLVDKERASLIGTNIALVALSGLGIWLLGWKTFLTVQVPISILASNAGTWMFYVQHQFEDTYWAEGSDWDIQDAAFFGSSHYDLPPVLQWFTANIGVHHVHYLASRN